MNRHAVSIPPRLARRRGFTLLELCIVLFIMALLASTAMPAMESAFTEEALRGDAHQLSLMVKTAMLKSSEEQRPYLLNLDGKELLMEPTPDPMAAAEAAPDSRSSSSDPESVIDRTIMTQTLGNTLKFPDARKKNTWEALPSVHWTFMPAGLCPVPRVRLERGRAYIEVSFNALTGDVEDEATYLP
jgi:prepilin-type N-terminal cleavage/methylation domain-containing protein